MSHPVARKLSDFFRFAQKHDEADTLSSSLAPGSLRTDPDGSESVLVRKRSGVWEVSVGGRFLGDYFEKSLAETAAADARQSIAHMQAKAARPQGQT